jgi:hypothetical protein
MRAVAANDQVRDSLCILAKIGKFCRFLRKSSFDLFAKSR